MEVTYNVLVVGAGGTGSYFIKEFSRYMAYDVQLDFVRKIRMCVVDGDKVEEKNLDRQSFSDEDIGEFKAVALVDAINSTFPKAQVIAKPMYITSKDEIIEIFKGFGRWFATNSYCYDRGKVFNVLIGACDNNRCRQVMHSWFEAVGDGIYIDSGNAYSNGQVVVAVAENRKVLSPDVCMLFPNILEDTSPDVTERSCSETNMSEPQHIATNMLAGNIILSHMAKITSGTISPGVTFFDALNQVVTFRAAEVLKAAVKDEEDALEEAEAS